MGLKPLPTLVEFVPKMMNRTWPFLLGSALFGVPLVIKSRNTSPEEIAMSPYMQKQAGVYYKYRKWEGEGIDPRFKRHDYKYTGNN